ncbi:translocation/assembly module TamB domain-containing protein [Enterovirga sp.]|uniref:translocation/assembly module TamB domain-containing protein n=1 Tax=Enterovirga sp. TaxID=2026350 RepID=UPI00261BF80E|nr:translocation/assembly module TamB domain-containing protein [Enterovirga sp.]MDB5591006.1 uncharacterized protein [Enterovirga sp.]
MRAVRFLAACLAVLLLLGGAALAQFGGSGDDERGVLASLISRALSTPATRVTIGAVEGALSSDATIRDIEISDRDGVWLRLDRARIVWRRLALLQRRLEIDRLEIGVLDIRRRPIPAEGQVPGENDPILPELPVKVQIEAFQLAELKLGEPLIGTDARVTANGRARLSNNTSEGLELTLDARRLDQPGTAAIRLGLVPQGQRLTLSVVVDEPAGGIVARAANLPGQPPVKLEVTGEGTLDAFAARLALDAGEGLGATGSATLARDGAARRLALDLQARLEALLPGAVSPVFAGTTRLTGGLLFGDDGAIGVEAVHLVAAAARVDVAGRIGPDGIADLTVAAANLQNRPGSTGAGATEIRRLSFQSRVTGPLTAPNMDATLQAEDVRTEAGRLAGLDATFRASAAGTTPGGATQLAITADARATGLVPSDPGLARALGDTLTLALRGTATTGGVVEAESLVVTSPTFTARYAGRLGSDEVRGRVAFEAASLRPFGDVAGLTLAGRAAVAAEIEGTPRARRLNATLDGEITRFATGIAAVDGAFAGRLALGGTLRVEPTGGYRFEALQLTSGNARAEVNGLLAQDSADLRVSATLPDLQRLDARVRGRAGLTATVTGGLQRPNVVAELAIADAAALGRPIPRLTLGLDLKDATGALEGTVRLDGIVDGKPARGGFRVARPAGEYRLDGLELRVGTVSLRGDVALDAASIARGRLMLSAPNLDDLSPLLLTRAVGTVEADITLEGSNGGQGAQVKLDATRVSVYGVTVNRAEADLRLADIYRRPVIDGQIRIDEASYGGESLSRLRLVAKGTAQASDVTLSAAARGFDLEGRARVIPGERIRIELAQLTATRDGQRLALANPATVTVLPGGAGADIQNLAVALGSGRLSVSGAVGSRLDLRVEARAVPLATAEILSPGLGLSGTLEGEARIAGTSSAPTGEYRARIANLSAPQIRGLGLPRIDIAASGRLAGGRATLEADIRAGRAGNLAITGSVPADGTGALDLAIRGGVDAGAATSGLLASGGRRLTGRIAVDARVTGTLAAPEATGSATLAGGSFSDAQQGIALTGITARLVARGQEVTVENARAATRNGGAITASGRVRVDPAAGFPGEIRVVGRNAELVRSGLATAVANLDITLSGPLARDPRVAGRVDLISADITVPESFSATLRPLPNTRHIHPTRTTRARLAQESKAKGKGGRAAPPFDARLDLVLNAPGRIVVRGRGLNAELGGALRLTGTLAKPVANGAFDLRRGTLQIVTSRLEFSRGRLTFTGDLTPELDFVASTNAGGAAIQVAVTGPSSDPRFEFTSSPALPQDEVLSRLLFNSPSGQLSAFQALALAQAAAQLSGGESGDAFEGLRRSLGLTGLDIGLGSSGGIGLGLQRALGDRVTVGIKGGSSAADTGIGVDVRITDEIRLQGEVGATGKSSVGIGAQYEW